MGDDYKSVSIEILGKTYKYKVDEPEDVVNEILLIIKKDVEKFARNIGREKLDEVLLLLLLNEKLETEKLKNNVQDIVRELMTKMNDVVDTTTVKNVKQNDVVVVEESEPITDILTGWE